MGGGGVPLDVRAHSSESPYLCRALTVGSRRGASLLFDGRQIQWKWSHLSVTPQRTGGEEPRRAGALTQGGDFSPKNKIKNSLSPPSQFFFFLIWSRRDACARLSCVEGIVYPPRPLAVEK